MDLEARMTALQAVPLFSEVEPADLERVARMATERRYEAGENVVTEGEPAAAMYVIMSGEAEAIAASGAMETHLGTLRPGAFFGEMALFEGFPRANSVRATTHLECLALTSWDVQAELRTTPSIAIQMLKAMARRLRSADHELASV